MERVSNAEIVLFRQIAEGDEKAFHNIFQLYLPKLYPFVIKLTRSEEIAQDLIQDAFTRVWISRGKLNEIENPGGWLYRVLANECYRYLRRQDMLHRAQVHYKNAGDADNSSHHKLEVAELKMIIAEAVYKLPPQRRLIYQMSRTEGKSIPEIAVALNLSPNTIKNALVLSLKFIREYLIQRGIIPLVVTFLIY